MIGFAYCTAEDLEPGDVLDCCGHGHAIVRAVMRNEHRAVVWLRAPQARDETVLSRHPIKCVPTTRFLRQV